MAWALELLYCRLGTRQPESTVVNSTTFSCDGCGTLMLRDLRIHISASVRPIMAGNLASVILVVDRHGAFQRLREQAATGAGD